MIRNSVFLYSVMNLKSDFLSPAFYSLLHSGHSDALSLALDACERSGSANCLHVILCRVTIYS